MKQSSLSFLQIFSRNLCRGTIFCALFLYHCEERSDVAISFVIRKNSPFEGGFKGDVIVGAVLAPALFSL